MFEAIVEAFEGDGEDQQVWQHRSVKFDIPQTFQYQPWQKVITVCQGVEDSKGNPGQEGSLIVSNIRVIWYMLLSKETNLSVGYDAITRVDKKITFLPGGGSKRFLTVKANKGNSRYEFQFCSKCEDADLVYDLIIRYYRAAADSLNYRKIQLRASLISKSGDLQPMLNEQVKSKYTNVKYFLDGNSVMGSLVISNVRIVWLAKDGTTNFSIPWVCIRNAKVKDNFDMDTLVLFVKDRHGQLEFILYSSNLKQMQTEVNRLLQTYKLKPFLGYDLSSVSTETAQAKPKEFNEDVEIVETQINLIPRKRTKNSYQVGDKTEAQINFEEIVYSEELGLAIEALPEGASVASLWEIFRT